MCIRERSNVPSVEKKLRDNQGRVEIDDVLVDHRRAIRDVAHGHAWRSLASNCPQRAHRLPAARHVEMGAHARHTSMRPAGYVVSMPDAS